MLKSKIESTKKAWASRFRNPSDLWNKVHIITGKNSAKDPVVDFVKSFDSVFTAASALNNHFGSVFSEDLPVDPLLFDSNTVTWEHFITVDSVINCFVKYPVNKAAGPDCIPASLYVAIVDVIAKPLCHIFNESIRTQTFPNRWKNVNVVPIAKCKKPTISDFRPVSLLSFPAKVFEKLVYNSFRHLFVSNFGLHQFGFREKSSTCCALISLHNHICELAELDGVRGVQVFALDLTKAFDKLRYRTIIEHLFGCYFPRDFILWLLSYLSNRSQCVRISSVLSQRIQITSGVPQGSVLGPALFNVVSSSLTPVHQSTGMFKFADDITLSIPIFHTHNNVVSEIDNINHWCTVTGLSLNVLKSKYIFIRTSTVPYIYIYLLRVLKSAFQ